MNTVYPVALTRRSVAAWLAVGTLGPTTAVAEPAPLMLANTYRQGLPLADYWVSEKYDGVRGFWNGKEMRTRGGEPVALPAWFTEGWPGTALDGELWAGHGAFARAVSTVRQHTPADAAWRGLRFMVFDLPAQGGSFDERLRVLQQTLGQVGTPWLSPVAQRRIASHAALMALMRQTVQSGGEGLVLHRGASLYRAVRSDDLVKLKPFSDADARVLAHVAGRGKYLGVMGALLVETPEGRRFKLGTGFSDAERLEPPPLGSWVTYRFRDVHPGGVPRFASFMRRRADLPG